MRIALITVLASMVLLGCNAAESAVKPADPRPSAPSFGPGDGCNAPELFKSYVGLEDRNQDLGEPTGILFARVTSMKARPGLLTLGLSPYVESGSIDLSELWFDRTSNSLTLRAETAPEEVGFFEVSPIEVVASMTRVNGRWVPVSLDRVWFGCRDDSTANASTGIVLPLSADDLAAKLLAEST